MSEAMLIRLQKTFLFLESSSSHYYFVMPLSE